MDFFLDRSTLTGGQINGYNGYPPNANITLFNLVDFINPNDIQLHNWNIGDVFESDNQVGDVWPNTGDDYILDTVTDKIISSHTVAYTCHGLQDVRLEYSSIYTGYIYYNSPIYSDSVYTIADTSYIPEHIANTGNYIFYFPGDSSLCLHSASYALVPAQYFTGGLGGDIQSTSYKLGIGEVSYTYIDGNPTLVLYNLFYYKMSGVECGSFNNQPLRTLSIKEINKQAEEVNLFPNPSKNELNITSSSKITDITISNLIGQTVYTSQYGDEKAQINIAALPGGIYMVRVTNEKGAQTVIKIVKE